MKRRLFITASAVLGTGALSNANAMGQVGHFVNLQQFTPAQKAHFNAFKAELKERFKGLPNGNSLLKKLCSVNSILGNEQKGANYSITFHSAANCTITLNQNDGEKKVFIG